MRGKGIHILQARLWKRRFELLASEVERTNNNACVLTDAKETMKRLDRYTKSIRRGQVR